MTPAATSAPSARAAARSRSRRGRTCSVFPFFFAPACLLIGGHPRVHVVGWPGWKRPRQWHQRAGGGGSRPDPARPLASPHTTPNSHSHATHTHTRSHSHSHSRSHSRTTHLEHARPSRRHMPVCLACKVAWTLAHVTNIPPPPPMLVFTLHTCYPPHHHLRACVRACSSYVRKGKPSGSSSEVESPRPERGRGGTPFAARLLRAVL